MVNVCAVCSHRDKDMKILTYIGKDITGNSGYNYGYNYRLGLSESGFPGFED
jgi:hypothetical protein